jgi:teichoic acid transport system permease protein
MQTTITAAASAMPKNQKLVKAIHFPRLVLPFATILQQIQQYLVSIAVLAVICLATGENLAVAWLLLPLVLMLQILFTAGFSLIVCRWGARKSDITQLLPFFTRTWRYASGVFFSIAVYTKDMHSLIGKILMYNPGAVYIDLIRDTLMTSHSVDSTVWIAGIVWALLFFGFGMIYFYKGESKYV